MAKEFDFVKENRILRIYHVEFAGEIVMSRPKHLW